MAIMDRGTVSVEDLLAAVKQLPPEKVDEFAREFSRWRGSDGEREAALVVATRKRLDPSDAGRLKRLAAKSEAGSLDPDELADYQKLARRAQEIDVTRIRALAELVKLRGKPVERVMEEIGWESADDDG